MNNLPNQFCREKGDYVVVLQMNYGPPVFYTARAYTRMNEIGDFLGRLMYKNDLIGDLAHPSDRDGTKYHKQAYELIDELFPKLAGKGVRSDGYARFTPAEIEQAGYVYDRFNGLKMVYNPFKAQESVDLALEKTLPEVIKCENIYCSGDVLPDDVGRVCARQATFEDGLNYNGCQTCSCCPACRQECINSVIEEDAIETERTDLGGWTAESLAQWGIPWPPPKGWKKELEKKIAAGWHPPRKSDKNKPTQGSLF